MLVKKTLAALSAVAILATAPGLAYAGDDDPLKKKQSQIFKTGEGTASGQGGGGGGIGACGNNR